MPALVPIIDTWIFDLDNTLYPAGSALFSQISTRMGMFIADLLKLDRSAARQLQKSYFKRYGTTLRGLMVEHQIDPHAFMSFVHDIDLSVLPSAQRLDQALARLPGRKLVHTNGSTRHAERVLAHLGLDRHFTGIFDIAAADWQPKPEPAGYHALIQRFAIDPKRAAMVEDMACNLKPADDLGMLTLWVSSAEDWAVDSSLEAFVQHRTDDLAGWLDAYTDHESRRAGRLAPCTLGTAI